VHLSISTKVTAACAAVLLPSLLLLGSGIRIGAEVGAANEDIGRLSQLLRVQDEQDKAQRALRLALGDATRIAERHGTVPEARWDALLAELRAFRTLSGATATEQDPRLPAELRATLAETRSAALAFVPIGQQLVDTARRDPDAVKARMPGFLDALKRLEAKRTAAREAFGRTIATAAEDAIAHNRRATARSLAGALTVIAALLVMALWLHRQVMKPIIAIAVTLRAFRSHQAVNMIVPGQDRRDEVGDLARGVSEYNEAVEAQRVAQRRIDFLAHHDGLTGLPNRLLFENRLAHELVRARRTGEKVAVFAIDLDEFKSVNDRYGHAGGDAALCRAGELLSGCIRASDLVARIGGDEFAIIQVAANQPIAAESLLARISRATALTADDDVPVQMSIGVAISAVEQDGDELRNAADMALYRAKTDGRNTARFFDASLQEEVGLRHRLGRDLEQAIELDQLHVAFQPIATPAGRVMGFEALLRWSHPELGAIAPDMFIPIAETTGQIGRIGAWVADHAMMVAAHWPTELTLALNLSPLQFRDTGLAGTLLALAAQHGIAADRLEFEVTESATLLGHHRAAVLGTLRRLQAAGARIVLDDFGTGHSSLSNLKAFSFDKLKIDRSFVETMLSDAPSAMIVKATIGLGKSLGMSVVAEGVETEPQLARLREWGCDQIQGYYIGRPMRYLQTAVA
jgi:diguanylate cyclase (GGDEF)-like protein